MCAARVCVKDYSFRTEEGILLNLLVFCFRYDSACPSVYTVMTLANSCCTANRSVLKLKDGNIHFLMRRDKQMCVCEKISYMVLKICITRAFT